MKRERRELLNNMLKQVREDVILCTIEGIGLRQDPRYIFFIVLGKVRMMYKHKGLDMQMWPRKVVEAHFQFLSAVAIKGIG